MTEPGEVLDELRSALTVLGEQIKGYRRQAETTGHPDTIMLIRSIQGETEGNIEIIDRVKWRMGEGG